MAYISGEILIDAPVEEVFDLVADERNEPTYNPRIVSARKVSDGPIGTGTRFTAQPKGMGGARGTMELEILECARPHRLHTVVRSSYMTVDGTLTFTAVNDRTLLRWDWTMKLTGPLRVLSPVLALVGPRWERRNWVGLKQYLESRRSPGNSYLAVPDGPGPFPGIVVIHEAFGLNENIKDVCRRFAGEGFVALGVDLFQGRNRAVCMARMLAGAMAGNLDHYGVPELKAALGELADHPEVDRDRLGAIGFCLGGSIVLTWGCTDRRLQAIAPFYGVAPKPLEASRRLCPVVGSWPGHDFTTKAAGLLETELTAAGVAHDLKVYPGAKHSFFNDQGRTYDSEAAADAWQRVLAFFDKHVRQGGPPS